MIFALADVCGLRVSSLFSKVKRTALPEGRFTIHKGKRTTFINDSYNANPASFDNALELFSAFPSGGRRILVCGDMLELGFQSDELHKKIGMKTATSNLDFVVGVGRGGQLIAGEFIENSSKPKKVLLASTTEEALEVLQRELEEHDIVLFKASRGMKFEKLIKGLSENALVEN